MKAKNERKCIEYLIVCYVSVDFPDCLNMRWVKHSNCRQEHINGWWVIVVICRKQFLIFVSIVTLSLIVIASGNHAFVIPTDANPEPNLNPVVPSSLIEHTTREL